jgi:glyoxylase-like metal-dependent hydrolase (beta-lactamase superfamily II)
MLLKYYPDAKVVCHPDGIRHMTNPSRLWEKTKEVLGGLAEAYGKIEPVSKECIVYSDRIETGDTAIDVIGTPGHAFHHLCYHAGENFFIGEAAGVTYPLEEGLYLRLSTPPVFEYEIYRDSLKKVASVKASNICFAHYGFRQDAENIFHAAFAQLDRWLSVVEENYCLGKGLSDEDIFDKILESDRTMALYDKLPSDVQYREKYFALNSVRGIKNYLAKKTGHSFSAEDRSPDFAGKG